MKFHLIRTLESITSPHKHKALTLGHISIPLIILNIKSGVETASVPWTDWHSVSVVLPANNMLSKSVQLTYNMVDNTQSTVCPYKGHEHWTWCSTTTADISSCCQLYPDQMNQEWKLSVSPFLEKYNLASLGLINVCNMWLNTILLSKENMSMVWTKQTT